MEAYSHNVEKEYGIELPTSTWPIPHSSVHLPGGCTLEINPGPVGDQFHQFKLPPLHFTQPIVSTVKFAEELRLYRLQVLMDFIHQMVLTVSTWMVLALPMDCPETTSGPLSVPIVRLLQVQMHAHAIPSLVPDHSPLLATTTTANRVIQAKVGKVRHFGMIKYGMESSAATKVHAALVPTLHHGSV